MKQFFTFLLIILSFASFSQSPGDTIVVETFNYTQTHGGGIRDTMIDFPDNPDISYEKVIMLYNMRCKNGLVSDASDRNKGCGEWDYSCNTYIHDSSRVDSVISFTNSQTLSNFSGDTYNYVESPTYNFYQYLQKDVDVLNTNTESLATVGTGNTALGHVLNTTQKSGKSQYLYTQSELAAAGLTAGTIDALVMDATGNTNAGFLRIKLKHTDKTNLSAGTPDFDEFTEVYFSDASFSTGNNKFQFYTPFEWNGT